MTDNTKLTTTSVAKMIGETWTISISDAINSDSLCIDWDKERIYTSIRPPYRGMKTLREYQGHVSVYKWRPRWRMNPAFFINLIADWATDIVAVADGYRAGDGVKNTAVFAISPKDLFDELQNIHAGNSKEIFAIESVYCWLDGSYRSLIDLKNEFKSDELTHLAQAIVEDALRANVILDPDHVMKFLRELEAIEHAGEVQ